MNMSTANTIAAAAQSTLRIERNDRRRPPWRIQLGNGRGACTFATLTDAIRFILATAPSKGDRNDAGNYVL